MSCSAFTIVGVFSEDVRGVCSQKVKQFDCCVICATKEQESDHVAGGEESVHQRRLYWKGCLAPFRALAVTQNVKFLCTLTSGLSSCGIKRVSRMLQNALGAVLGEILT
jgi:hypothetical protein